MCARNAREDRFVGVEQPAKAPPRLRVLALGSYRMGMSGSGPFTARRRYEERRRPRQDTLAELEILQKPDDVKGTTRVLRKVFARDVLDLLREDAKLSRMSRIIQSANLVNASSSHDRRLFLPLCETLRSFFVSVNSGKLLPISVEQRNLPVVVFAPAVFAELRLLSVGHVP